VARAIPHLNTGGARQLRKQLRIARITAELSQKELAQLVGVSQQTIAKWERGVTSPSHLKHIRAISATLKQPMDVLFPDVFDQKEIV